jgi:hypothetical protein
MSRDEHGHFETAVSIAAERDSFEDLSRILDLFGFPCQIADQHPKCTIPNAGRQKLRDATSRG